MVEPSLVEKIIEIHAAFERAGIGHAFGGALAMGHDSRVDRLRALERS